VSGCDPGYGTNEETGKVDPCDHVPVPRRNLSYSIRVPHIRENGPFYVFEFVELIDVSCPVLHDDVASFLDFIWSTESKR
jgi:hypothetical protein